MVREFGTPVHRVPPPPFDPQVPDEEVDYLALLGIKVKPGLFPPAPPRSQDAERITDVTTPAAKKTRDVSPPGKFRNIQLSVYVNNLRHQQKRAPM